MVDISRILEIKKNGAETATKDDIKMFYGIIAEYLNADALDVIKDLNVTIAIDIDGDKSSLIIKGGKAEFKPEDTMGAEVQLFADVKTMAAIATGSLDAQKAFLSGAMEIDGEFDKMIDFLELLEGAYEKLGITTKGERDILVDAATMKKLFNIYEAGATDVDSADIPLFFNIFCTFINLNEEAQDVVEDEELRVQMMIKDVGPYLIYKDGDEVKWSAEKVEDAILEFEVSIKTAADILLGGDAASAYLSGEVVATGNIAQALILQELLELFLEILPFTV